LVLGCCCPARIPDSALPSDVKAERDHPSSTSGAATPEKSPTAWQYDTSDDEMGRGKIKTATLESTNEFEFDFPYADPQRATLMLRKHPKYGNDAILSVEKGQFLTGINGTSVEVRFDSGKAREYKALEPEDHSTTAIFIERFEDFVARAKKAKKVRIEASFFQEGSRVLEFDVAGLKF
jgi:hypothetical protein